MQDALRDFAIGQRIQLRVVLGDQTFSLTGEVRRRSHGVLGLQVIEPDPKYQTAVTALFRREIEAVRMVQVPSHLLQEPEVGEALFFRGSDQTELYLHTQSDSVESFQLAFFGHVLEGVGESLRYGVLSPGDAHPARIKESDLILWHQTIDTSVVDAMTGFIQNISGLSERLKSDLVAKLSSLPRADAPQRLRVGGVG